VSSKHRKHLGIRLAALEWNNGVVAHIVRVGQSFLSRSLRRAELQPWLLRRIAVACSITDDALVEGPDSVLLEAHGEGWSAFRSRDGRPNVPLIGAHFAILYEASEPDDNWTSPFSKKIASELVVGQILRDTLPGLGPGFHEIDEILLEGPEAVIITARGSSRISGQLVLCAYDPYSE
jgi:hypothetical protein